MQPCNCHKKSMRRQVTQVMHPWPTTLNWNLLFRSDIYNSLLFTPAKLYVLLQAIQIVLVVVIANVAKI